MSDMLLETIEMLCSPEAEIMPDGVRLTRLIRAANEAAALITSLREALETAQAEIVQTREVCSLVRRQDYFDVPTPVLVEAQIEIAKWTAYDDLIRVAEFQRPAVDGALTRYRARALNPSRKETI